MQECGKIIAINDDIAVISLEPSDACHGCPAQSYCRPQGEKRVLEAIPAADTQVGDMVRVVISPKRGLLAALLFFGLPVMLGIAAMIITIQYGEVTTIVCGVGSFILGLVAAKIINDVLAHKRAFLPRIAGKVDIDKS